MAEAPAEGSIEARLRGRAEALGFADIGIATADDPGHIDYLKSWLAAGNHGEMAWLAAPDAVRRRGDLTATLEGARSVVVVAEPYPVGVGDVLSSEEGKAIVARYAQGRDYHLTLVDRLRALGTILGPAESWTAYTDTGPILERDLARRAGLGWFGRNTLLIHPKRGSYFLLGVILTTRELTPNAPFEADHCGSCNACVDACPTGALLGRDADGAPRIDAKRCISYLTIELRGAIPEELRPALGTRVFGCDICQEVCPWNGKFAQGQVAHPDYEPKSWPGDGRGDSSLPSLEGPQLVAFTERVLSMSGKEYLRVFRESPLGRPRRTGMLRNLCVALGNWGAGSAEAAAMARPALERAAQDRSELVREHAAWGLGRLPHRGG